MSTLPPDKLSTTAQSSAIRKGVACCGLLTLPALSRILLVIPAKLAASGFGLGKAPVKAAVLH